MIEFIKALIMKPFWSVYDGVYDGALDIVTKCYIGNHDGNYDPVLISEFGSLLIAN